FVVVTQPSMQAALIWTRPRATLCLTPAARLIRRDTLPLALRRDGGTNGRRDCRSTTEKEAASPAGPLLFRICRPALGRNLAAPDADRDRFGPHGVALAPHRPLSRASSTRPRPSGACLSRGERGGAAYHRFRHVGQSRARFRRELCDQSSRR